MREFHNSIVLHFNKEKSVKMLHVKLDMSVALPWIHVIIVMERPKERVQCIVLYIQAFVSSTFCNSSLESNPELLILPLSPSHDLF